MIKNCEFFDEYKLKFLRLFSVKLEEFCFGCWTIGFVIIDEIYYRCIYNKINMDIIFIFGNFFIGDFI